MQWYGEYGEPAGGFYRPSYFNTIVFPFRSSSLLEKEKSICSIFAAVADTCLPLVHTEPQTCEISYYYYCIKLRWKITWGHKNSIKNIFLSSFSPPSLRTKTFNEFGANREVAQRERKIDRETCDYFICAAIPSPGTGTYLMDIHSNVYGVEF